MLWILRLLAIFLVLACAGDVRAQMPTAGLPGARTVSALEARDALVQGAVALDLRRIDSFELSRLPGARPAWLAFDTRERRFDASAYGIERGTPIVVYHDGPSGLVAYRAISAAVAAGHTNLMWLRGGVAEWVGNGLPTESGPVAVRAAAILGSAAESQ